MSRIHQDDLTQLNERLNGITLSTGNVNRKYIVRDIIFATDMLEVDLFAPEENPNEIFANVSQKLKQMAFEYEADAVINCHFEPTFSERGGRKVVEIFAYGTVVQFTQTNIG